MQVFKFGSASVFFILAFFLFTSCDKKTTKNSIEGKWGYKDIIFTPGYPAYDMTEHQKNAARSEAKGTTFQFNKDGTYTVTPGYKEAEILKGSYTIQDDSTMVLKNVRHPAGKAAKISFPDKNTLKIGDDDLKIAIVLEKLD